MKNVLIVSPHFPPVNAPDLQRVRMSLPYYRNHGWNPVVLTVDEAYQNTAIEPDLAATVPRDVEVVRTRAVPPSWARRFGVGNIGLRAWGPIFAAGCGLLQRRKFDLVFFSTTQFAVYPMGPLWKRLFGVPFAIDIQDPWKTSYYFQAGARKPPGGWKYRFSHIQACLGEPLVYRDADGFISVSAGYFSHLEAHYPWFVRKPRFVIPFGTSGKDLETAKSRAPGYVPAKADPDTVRVVYTGAAGPIMPDALRCLFAGFDKLRRTDPVAAKRLRFEFLGTSYAEPGRAKPSVTPVAAEWRMAGNIHEEPARLGHLACLRIQAEADVLLLLGSIDLSYSPSKIYPYYLSGRPMFSLAFRGSVLASLLTELGCGTTVLLEPGAEPEQSADEVAAVLAQAVRAPQSLERGTRRPDDFRQRFLAESLTEQQCALFEEARSRKSS